MMLIRTRNSYARSCAKDSGKIVGSIYRSRKYLTLAAMFHLDKNQISPKMEHRGHIWAGDDQSSLSNHQKLLCGLAEVDKFCIVQTHSIWCNLLSPSLIYHYFQALSSDELYFLVTLVQSYIDRKQCHLIRIKQLAFFLSKCKSYFRHLLILSRIILCETDLSCGCFINLIPFKSRFNSKVWGRKKRHK